MDHPKQLIFKLNDNGQGPDVVRQAFLEQGWTEYEEDEQQEHQWNFWWKTSRFSNSEYESLMPWQRINHYPKSTILTKKDGLLRNVRRMQGIHGRPVYNFIPQGFNLPNDYMRFVGEYSRMREKHPDEPMYWICKPADMSRGRGIFMFSDLSDLQYNCSAVVQQYISNPLLISGYKFDLRIYAVVTNFHPMRVYVFREGIVRFSTEKYDLSTLGNHFAHLTNSSINKYGPMYLVDKERIGTGCKWTLTQLRHYFLQNRLDNGEIFAKIIHIVNLTLLMQANQSIPSRNCFELYGIDIMIDENLKPWLLEVNYSPALTIDCPADVVIKKALVSDIISLMGFVEKDKDHGGDEYLQQQRHVASLVPRSYIPGSQTRRESLEAKKDSKWSSFTRFPAIAGVLRRSAGLRRRKRMPSNGSDQCETVDSGQSSDDSDTDVKDLDHDVSPRTDRPYLRNSRYQSLPAYKKTSSNTSQAMLSSRYGKASYRSVRKPSVHKSDSGISTSSSNSCSDILEGEWGRDEPEDGAGAALKPVLENTDLEMNTEKSFRSSDDFEAMLQKRISASPALVQSKKMLQSKSEVHTVSYGRSQVLHHAHNRLGLSKDPCKVTLVKVINKPLTSSRQPKTYDRPWRKTKEPKDGAEEKEAVVVGGISQAEACGDLVLIYPFNDVTRRPVKPGSDQKLLVKECQKFLKHLLMEVDRSQSDGSASKLDSRPSTVSTQRTITPASSRSNSVASKARTQRSRPQVSVQPKDSSFTYVPNLWLPLSMRKDTH